MNGMARKIALLMVAALSGLITAAVFLLFQVKYGQALYPQMAWEVVPAGAIGAGIVAALGFYAGALLLRARPSKMVLVALVVFSAGTVFVMNSVEYGLMAVNASSLNAGNAGAFVAKSLSESPLTLAVTGGASSGGQAASSTGAGRQLPSVAGDNDAAVQGIGGNVSSMMAAGKAVSTENAASPIGGVSKRVAGMEAYGSGVLSHSAALELAAVQSVGFLLGGLLAYAHLRTYCYCDGCMVFLSRKGEQTRYFDSMRDIQGSVDAFLTTAKGRQYRQSIQAHFDDGSAAEKGSSAFASTVEIRRCKACDQHRLKFIAQRKDGRGWKEIGLLGYETFCMEPLDIA